ncbi:MAG: TPR domain protein in aerotolerance operon, partial [uncultured Sulfurovum sp.]
MRFKIILYGLLSPLLFADMFDFQTIEKANSAYVEGDFNKSAKLFGSLKNSDSTVAYDKANAEYKAGRYDEALSSYKKAKGVDEAQRQHNIGNAHFKKQELDKAIEAYEKALEVRDDEDTKHNLELAKKKKKEEEQKKEQDKKNEDKDKKDDKNKDDKKKQD